MSAKKVKKVSAVKVKLSEKAKAADKVAKDLLKKERAEAKKNKVTPIVIETPIARINNKGSGNPFTPIVEKEMDIALTEKGLSEYQNDPTKGGTNNAYFVGVYTKNLKILKKELKALKK